MRCPFCHSLEDKVIDSRMSKDGLVVRRRRECLSCGKRYTTHEKIEESMPMVIKKDGRREPYLREKLLTGIRKAFEKRPVSVEEQEDMVNQIERMIVSLGEPEVSSQQIGEFVIAMLRDTDEVAYVRFASVYRQFKDVTDFLRELRELLPPELRHHVK
jgi:transcriptional repressor NrdR